MNTPYQSFPLPSYQPDGLPGYEARFRTQLEWLEIWDIEKILREEEVENPIVTPFPTLEPTASGQSLFQPRQFDSAPDGFTPGAIRVLSAQIADCSPQTPYVLLLGEWTEGWSWIMPFSPFDLPATEHELLTGMEPNPLQVLQVWQARSLPDELLQKSWFVTHAPAALVTDAKALYSQLLRGDNRLPVELIDRISTRLSGSADDPRLAYLDEQAHRLESVTACSLRWLESQTESGPEIPDNLIFVSFRSAEAEPALAAASTQSFQTIHIHAWEIRDTSIRIELTSLLTDPSAWTLRVFDDTDGVLEGATIYTDSGKTLATIHYAIAGDDRSPLRFPGDKLAIRLADGKSVSLEPVTR